MLQSNIEYNYMARRSLTLYVAAPALVMFLALMGGAQHAAFRLCLQRTALKALDSGQATLATVRQTSAELEAQGRIDGAYAETATTLYEHCNATRLPGGYESTVVRAMWTQFIKLEPAAPVLSVYAAFGRQTQQTHLNEEATAQNADHQVKPATP